MLKRKCTILIRFLTDEVIWKIAMKGNAHIKLSRINQRTVLSHNN